jgi:hypothetical protein
MAIDKPIEPARNRQCLQPVLFRSSGDARQTGVDARGISATDQKGNALHHLPDFRDAQADVSSRQLANALMLACTRCRGTSATIAASLLASVMMVPHLRM